MENNKQQEDGKQLRKPSIRDMMAAMASGGRIDDGDASGDDESKGVGPGQAAAAGAPDDGDGSGSDDDDVLEMIAMAKKMGLVAKTGKKIGNIAKDPPLTSEQKARQQKIARIEPKAPIINKGNLRNTTMGSTEKFTVRSGSGVAVLPPAFVDNVSFKDVQFMIGNWKPSTVGGVKRLYNDLVMRMKDGAIIPQYVSGSIIVQEIDPSITDKLSNNKMGTKKKGSRVIGRDFARIGLPKHGFDLVMRTAMALGSSVENPPGETPGYYWVNAGWGVATSPAVATYKMPDEDEPRTTSDLRSLFKMFDCKSFMGRGVVGISVSCKPKINARDQQETVDISSVKLSVKLFEITVSRVGDWSGPPIQQTMNYMTPEVTEWATPVATAKVHTTFSLNDDSEPEAEHDSDASL